MAKIDCFAFDLTAPERLRTLKHHSHKVGSNWPVVYILNDAREAYVGETVHVSVRAEQHLLGSKNKHLTEIRVISDEDFNKSVILDLESFLIKHMHADNKFKMLNGNNGLQDHDYYQRAKYNKAFEEIWAQLKRQGVVKNSLEAIENSELYKYSPYKSLGEEQQIVETQIIKALAEGIEDGKRVTILVRGGAGTGKTILGIYLMKFFSDCVNGGLNDDEPELLDDPDMLEVFTSENLGSLKKIGIVIPQKSLKTSIKDVFKSVKGLNPKMVLSPAEAAMEYITSGEKFDLLLVDEAHRLKCRYKGHLSNYRIFDNTNKRLDLDPMYGTELDWLLETSKNIILFRDELQTVRPCDIGEEDFLKTVNEKYPAKVERFDLSVQWRCQGGNDYINYLKGIFAGTQSERLEVENYDVALYDDCNKMIEAIKEKDRQLGLCRNVAGYAWPWDRKRPNEKTIGIQGHNYMWNRVYDNWIKSATAIDEIGCIHTVQGYDLNYAGVIIGEDIKYDPVKKKIYPVKENYFDQQGKSGVADNPDLLLEYLGNIYLTLLTRGIKGTYIYVCDDNLREYFKNFFEVRS